MGKESLSEDVDYGVAMLAATILRRLSMCAVLLHGSEGCMSRFDYSDPGQDAAYCDGLAADEDEATPVEESLIDVHRQTDALTDELQELAHRVGFLVAERQHIAQVLAAFYRAPVSLSSLQPILDLAGDMNPSLKP